MDLKIRALKSGGVTVSLGLAAALLMAGCASTSSPDADQVSEVDPYEGFNRGVFAVNETLDEYVFEPIAKGYRFVVPRPVRTSIGNALSNLGEPVTFLNDSLQGERERAGTTLSRFFINSTLGVAGLFDAAGQLGYQRHDEDFGQTLGVYGVDQGPYLMLPVLGPSTVRDLGGTVVDIVTDPFFFIVGPVERLARGVVSGVDTREGLIEEIDELERSSLDPYASVRTIYLQARRQAVFNGSPPVDDSAFDEEFDDFDEEFDDPAFDGGGPAGEDEDGQGEVQQ
ncbi:MAG: VacJ family lipoprotein [Geminicoccaceae bacterium]